MSRFARFPPLLLALGLFLGIAIAFRPFIFSYVVEPVALSLWLAWRVLLSVDQSVYWTVLVLLCVAWIIALLPRGNNDISPQTDQKPRRPEIGVKRWQTLFQDAALTAEGQDELRTRLRSLLASVIGAVDQPGAAEWENVLRAKHISLPPEIHRYLFPDAANSKPLTAKHFRHLLLDRWLRFMTGGPAVPDGAAIDEFLRWMESMMETTHDQ